MTNIVKRLRYAAESTDEWPLVIEAADEIQKLRAELQYARDGLTKGRTRMREDIDAMRAHIRELQENGDRLREIADAAVRDQRDMIEAVAGPLRDEVTRLRDALSCKPADDDSRPPLPPPFTSLPVTGSQTTSITITTLHPRRCTLPGPLAGTDAASDGGGWCGAWRG